MKLSIMENGDNMTAQERFDNLPNHYVPISTEAIVKHWLKGQTASANHPITPLNPGERFTIHDVKIEDGRIYVRGKNTMWFAQELIKVDVCGF